MKGQHKLPPTRRRKRGRSKTTWRRTVLKEVDEMEQDLIGRSTNQGSVAVCDCGRMSQPAQKGLAGYK